MRVSYRNVTRCIVFLLITSAERARIAFSRPGGIDTYPDAKTSQNAEKQPEQMDYIPLRMGRIGKGAGKPCGRERAERNQKTMKTSELIIDIETKLTISDDTVNRLLCLLAMWQNDNPTKTIVRGSTSDGKFTFYIKEPERDTIFYG